jgi:hypothetical protein
MPVLDDIFKKKSEYRRCVLADIHNHYKCIKQWVPEGEETAFKERMADCVEDETAWCLNDAFLYYEKVDKRMAYGVALYGMVKPMDILSLFIGVFSLEDNDTAMMRFKLHPGKFMDEYKSMLTIISMKRSHQNPNHPLMIRIDNFRQKIVSLLNLNGVRNR